MPPEIALIELLDRVGARRGAIVLLSGHELSTWPAATVSILKSTGLLAKAPPAKSSVCPGCERECTMPVHVLMDSPGTPEAFIVCDKRSDINRVSISIDKIQQWQASGESIAALLATLLNLRRPGGDTREAGRWEVGMLKGVKHSGHVVLIADGKLRLSISGHTVALSDVLTLDGNNLLVDRRALNKLVDHPVTGGGDVESAEQRQDRLWKRVESLRAKGVRAFLKVVAEEEGITISRVKQILARKKKPTEVRANR